MPADAGLPLSSLPPPTDAERAGKGGASAAAAAAAAAEAMDLDGVGGGWGDDDDLPGVGGEGSDDGMGGGGFEDAEAGGSDAGGSGGWEMEDLEIPVDVAAASHAAAADSSAFVAPPPGVSAAQRWQSKCALAGEQAAAGAFDVAMRLLTRQLGIVEFGPMRPYFLDMAAGSHATLPMLPGLPAVAAPLDRAWAGDVPRAEPAAPANVYCLAQLEDQLKKAYRTVTEGKFR